MLNQIISPEKAFARTIIAIDITNTAVTIKLSDGAKIHQSHSQDCCEIVEVTQVDGTPSNHIGAVLYSLEEKITEKEEGNYEHTTFTFYTLKTSKGYLDWRWTGESNGYYSETVDCVFTPSNKI